MGRKKPFSKLFELSQQGVTNEQHTITHITLNDIVPNRFQPRNYFNEQTIKELARSIKENDLLQPIIVREISPNLYEIIAGERRYRAVKSLGWGSIPAIINNMTDNQVATLALIENIQREELSAIEEAQAFKQLLSLREITQQELAQSIGKTQSSIANKIRLLKLTPEVQQAIINQKITERHGRALLALDELGQKYLLKKITSQQLNVLQTEQRIKQYLIEQDAPQQVKKYNVHKVIHQLQQQVQQLAQQYETDIDVLEAEGIDFIELTIKIPRYNK